MRIKLYLFLLLSVIFIGCGIYALSENQAETEIIPGDEWSWSRGAYNSFTGQIDLSECTGRVLKIRISADLQYDPETEQESMPVFTSVNGKRIVMTKQNDTVQYNPENDGIVMEYSGSFRLPEKQHVSIVPFVIYVTDEDDKLLKTISGRIESTENGTESDHRQFYFSLDINRLTLILSIVAAMVWSGVLIRKLCKKDKIQENENADL